MLIKIIVFVISLSFLSGCGAAERQMPGRWIDLSHDFSSETVYWLTAEPF